MMKRRDLFKALGAAAGAAVGSPLLKALAAPETPSHEFFVLIHASGGWDVTLWSDPRFEPTSKIDPATDALVEIDKLKHWKAGGTVASAATFAPVKKGGLILGPCLGDLLSHSDKITLFNGVSMETVSHQDGTYYSATGRHLAGGRPTSISINTALANEFSVEKLLPNISINFPSTFLEGDLDLRVLPLRVSEIATVERSLKRSNLSVLPEDRDAITLLLADEAQQLAGLAHNPAPYQGLGLQYEALRDLIASGKTSIFDSAAIKKNQPTFFPASPNALEFQGAMALNAAFTVEAFKSDLTRCVSFSTSSFDTHSTNYLDHGLRLQECFDVIARMIEAFEATPHPTKASAKLADHVHFLVISEFCRTPQINLQNGRDHYPNNTAMIISPRFKGGTVWGKSRPDDLLPDKVDLFGEKQRPINPADVLSTFLHSFGVNPRKYLRDGEVIQQALV
jgi:hypothetical protein